MSWTGDAWRDADIYHERLMRRERRLPRCADCREPIESKRCYVFGKKIYCPECIEELHETKTEYYMSE